MTKFRARTYALNLASELPRKGFSNQVPDDSPSLALPWMVFIRVFGQKVA